MTWLDHELYPFEHRYLDVGPGRMQYLDEGAGDTIVFVHGTPTWSFLWRQLIRDLRRDHRCVAPDHLGFGLSDKPADWSYTPEAHACNLETLIGKLELRDVTLVVHDFGGPIGLAYALEHTPNVARIVLMNTWMWSNQGNRAIEGASRLLAGPVGRFLYLRLNFSARVLLKGAFADKRNIPPNVHRHYIAPLGTPAERQAAWVLARELTGSNAWYDSLWQRRDELQDTPMLILWGLTDKFITAAQFLRWRVAFPAAQAVTLNDVGHFVPEEAPEASIDAIRTFVEATSKG